MQSRSLLFTLSILFTAGACGDDGGPADPSATDGTTTAATTDAQPTTAPTTGDPSTTNATTPDPSTSSDGATTGVDPTGGTTTDEPATTTGATTGGDTTTAGEPDPELLEACAAYCGRWDECGFQPDLAGCIAGCADSRLAAPDACKAANLTALECATALGCLDLLASLEEGGPCSAEEAAATAACEGSQCAEGFIAGGDSCEFSRECPGEPPKLMQCDTETCTCLDGDQKTGECAAEGVCGDADALAGKAAACCRFG